MRYIDLTKIDTQSSEFKEWKEKADNALNELIKKTSNNDKKEYIDKNQIWKDFKPILVKTFGEKCWYSDYCIEGEDGDVDHFRPKKKSKDIDKTCILENGYWWLAYDYTNYRLSCIKCNRARKPYGKSDYFPLKEGTLPAEIGEKSDSNVLIDPCCIYDTELIDCDDVGKIMTLSSNHYDIYRVSVSNDIYNLDLFSVGRREIRTKCKITIEILDILYEDLKNQELLEKQLELLKEIVSDNTSYSSFAKKYIKNKINNKPYKELLLEYLNII